MDFDRITINVDFFKQENMPSISNKKENFIRYANFCQLRSYNNKYRLRSEQAILKQAEMLLAELENNYNLK